LKFWRDAVGVAGGTVLAQGLGLLGYVLLARIFPVAAFGQYATWVAASAIIATFVSGALETTFVQEDDGQPRRSALVAVLATAAIGAAAVTLVIAVIDWTVPELLPKLGRWALYTMGAGGLALAACTVSQSWASASGYFRALTGNRIVQSLAITLIPSAGGLFARTAETMVLGHLAGLVLTAALWIFVLRPTADDLSHCRHLWSYWSGRRRTFKMVLPALAVGSVAGNIPLLAVQSRFGSVAAGHLALTLRALGAPITLVGVALRDVFKRHASVAFRERGECRTEYLTTLAALSAVAAGFALFMVVAGEFAFVLVFGEEWRMAGTMAVWLLPGYSMAIVAAPLSYLIYIVRREDVDLFWQSVMLVLALATMLLAPGLQAALIAYSIAAAGMYLVYIAVCYRMAAGTAGRRAG
jgi:O-antigen/teichoic acid export membrane protein